MITDTTGWSSSASGVGGAWPGCGLLLDDRLHLDDGVAGGCSNGQDVLFTLWVIRSQRLGSSGRSSLPPVSKEYTVT